MEIQKLDVKVRSRCGKGPARRVRQKGQVPAILYGPGLDSVSLVLPPSELIEALSGELRINTPLNLVIGGGKKETPKECVVMVRDHQYDPLTRDLMHVDFLAVDIDKKMIVNVPLVLNGRAIGEQVGGIVSIVFREIQVECFVTDIPANISCDVTNLDLNDVLPASELVVPKNVKVLLDPEQSVVTVVAKRIEVEETEGEEGEEGAEGEGEEGAEGEGEKKEGGEDKKSPEPDKK